MDFESDVEFSSGEEFGLVGWEDASESRTCSCDDDEVVRLVVVIRE
jgi:hypothetical protein